MAKLMTVDESALDEAAKASFQADWPNDDWARFKANDHVPTRYRNIVRAAILAYEQHRRKQEPVGWRYKLRDADGIEWDNWHLSTTPNIAIDADNGAALIVEPLYAALATSGDVE